MSVPQKSYEPRNIAAGDTLSWARYLSNFPASAGWQLTYELRGNGQAIEFESTANGDSHVILVPAATTALWLPAEYVMEGFAGNVASSERQRIFLNNLTVGINLETAPPDEDVKTHAQKMVEIIQGVQSGKNRHDILESDVEGTRIKRLSPKELRDEYNYWVQIRQTEIKAENSRNGRSNGRNRFTVFTGNGVASVGQFGALPPIFPFGGQNGC